MINTLKSVLNFFSIETRLNILFNTIVILSLIVFVLALILSLTVVWFTKKIKLSVAIFYTITLAIGIGTSIYNTFFLIGYVYIFCMDSVFFYVIMCLPQKKFKVTEKQKELVNFIDEEIKKQTTPALKPILDKIIITNPPNQQPLQEKPEVDFSHVKGILERLEYFPLSAGDKKQVNCLRSNLLEAQNGKIDFDTKRRINDGLSDLLKIMAKYGV